MSGRGQVGYGSGEDEATGGKVINLSPAPVADSYAAVRQPPSSYIPEINISLDELADGSVTTAKIATNAITDVKLRDSAALSVIGRAVNSVGDPADIASGTDLTVLSRAGTSLGFTVIVTSGVYSPTLTSVTNIQASTTAECQYLRIGSTVLVSGVIQVDPTAAAASELGISLPIASDFGAVSDCGGTAVWTGVAQESAGIRGDATNNRAAMVWVATDATDQQVAFTFTYQVI